MAEVAGFSTINSTLFIIVNLQASGVATVYLTVFCFLHYYFIVNLLHITSKVQSDSKAIAFYYKSVAK